MRALNMDKYIVSKIDNKQYCKINGQFTRYLKSNGLSYQEYYEQYVTGVKQLCGCGKPKTFYQKDHTYANSCGDPKCVGNTISEVKANWTDEQRMRDSENKRKASATLDHATIKQKAKQTYKGRYGSEWANSDQQKVRSKKTKLARYGNEYYSGWEKSAETNRNKSITEQNEINDRRRKTNLSLYGVENCFMMPESIHKARRNNSLGRDYVLPSGKVIGIRGHEDLVLDILLETYTEEQLVIDNRKDQYCLPVFDYITIHRQHYKYYPDIHIPSENLIIEVKSEWWWNGKGDDRYVGRYENNMRKKQAVLDAGYNYKVYLFYSKEHHEILEWN